MTQSKLATILAGTLLLPGLLHAGDFVSVSGLKTEGFAARLDGFQEAPALGPPEERVIQSHIAAGQLTLDESRRAGLQLFTTPFNKFDGFGDGAINAFDST